MTPPEPEAQARQEIDRLLIAAGWHVCDFGAHDISKPCAIREFPLKSGHGHADYLLYLHGKAVGVVENNWGRIIGVRVKTGETSAKFYFDPIYFGRRTAASTRLTCLTAC